MRFSFQLDVMSCELGLDPERVLSGFLPAGWHGFFKAVLRGRQPSGWAVRHEVHEQHFQEVHLNLNPTTSQPIRTLVVSFIAFVVQRIPISV